MSAQEQTSQPAQSPPHSSDSSATAQPLRPEATPPTSSSPSSVLQSGASSETQPSGAFSEHTPGQLAGSQASSVLSSAGRGQTSALLSAAPAGLGARFAAALVDSVVLTAVFLVVYVILFVLTAVAGAINQSLGELLGLLTSFVLFALAAVGVAYYALSVGRLGQTIGKRTLGVKVIDVASGNPIGAGRALARYFLFALMALPCYLGYLTFFTDGTGQNRAFHDKSANDLVVQVAPTSFGQAVRDVILACRRRA